MTSDTFKIRSEEDAWELIDIWLAGQSIPTLDFENWPALRIKIDGKGYASSLRSGQMEALIGFRQSMGRAYAAIAHGAYDMRRLKKAESEQLEFTTTVRKGSSIADTDLSPLIHAAAQVVQNRPIESLIAAVVVGLAIVAKPIILKHFENKAKQLEIEDRNQLLSLTQQITTQDRERWEKLDSAIERLSSKFPALDQLIPDVSTSFWQLASSAADANNVQIGDVNLNSHQLDVLSERRKRRKSDTQTIDDIFIVDGIVKIGPNYRIQLRSETAQFSVLYREPEMTPTKIKRLINCMTSTKAIRATITVRIVEKSQVSGELLRFSAAPTS
ncbi:hypothetical protein G3N59_22510 [Paraburkholderia sp. Ac-20340]|uniref:hypothetical protein n=1 Tax=Paraburkholderia sp. Ac-20340 TaxID=2703888 RepID=UPI00197FD17D|nr:hypothetical protein [Paraburkholderia sp. Ac-20340]MBN3856150.1 hypothetical protein [Paraburkholderia sp. Ac-20340]